MLRFNFWHSHVSSPTIFDWSIMVELVLFCAPLWTVSDVRRWFQTVLTNKVLPSEAPGQHSREHGSRKGCAMPQRIWNLHNYTDHLHWWVVQANLTHMTWLIIRESFMGSMSRGSDICRLEWWSESCRNLINHLSIMTWLCEQQSASLHILYCWIATKCENALDSWECKAINFFCKISGERLGPETDWSYS